MEIIVLTMIDQEHYIKKVLNDFELNDTKNSPIPLDSNYEAFQITYTDILPSNEEFQKLIGCLLYLSRISRPDIAIGVNLLSQKGTN